MQKGPELLEGVLQWCAGDEKTMIRPELHEGTIEKRIVVLQSVSFVDYQGGPGKASEELFVLEEDLIGGEERIELELVVGVADLMLTNLRMVGMPAPKEEYKSEKIKQNGVA